MTKNDIENMQSTKAKSVDHLLADLELDDASSEDAVVESLDELDRLDIKPGDDTPSPAPVPDHERVEEMRQRVLGALQEVEQWRGRLYKILDEVEELRRRL